MKSLAPFAAVFFFASASAAQETPSQGPPANEPASSPSDPSLPTPPPLGRASAGAAETIPERPEPRFDVIRLNAGAKVGYVTSDGFDTFAGSNTLAQVSVDGTVPLLVKDKLVLAAGLGWDVGGRKDDVRGLTSKLTTHRFLVPIEARWNYVPGLYTFVKVAPGAAAMVASVSDGSRTLGTTGWAFAADASVGASLLVGSRKTLHRRDVRFWITPEGGYSFTSTASLNANPGRPDDQILGSDENTRVGSLALSGVFWRISVSATY